MQRYEIIRKLENLEMREWGTGYKKSTNGGSSEERKNKRDNGEICG